jgi:exosortase
MHMIDSSTIRRGSVPLLSLLIVSVLTWPVWRWLWGEWMHNEYYSHGLLIVPVSLFLAYKRLRNDPELQNAQFTGSNYGLLLTAAALGAYLFLLNERAFYLAAFAMIALIGGLVWSFGGGALARKWAFPLGYLMLMVPLPFLERSTLPLAMFSGICSTGLVRFFGLEVTVVGNAVTLPNADLVIGAQCSGLNSLIALTALTVLVAYVMDGSLRNRLALVAVAMPLAIVGNILRISSLLYVARYFGAETAFIFYHDYSGPGFFLVVIGLMLPMTRVLRCGSLRPEVI